MQKMVDLGDIGQGKRVAPSAINSKQSLSNWSDLETESLSNIKNIRIGRDVTFGQFFNNLMWTVRDMQKRLAEVEEENRKIKLNNYLHLSNAKNYKFLQELFEIDDAPQIDKDPVDSLIEAFEEYSDDEFDSVSYLDSIRYRD